MYGPLHLMGAHHPPIVTTSEHLVIELTIAKFFYGYFLLVPELLPFVTLEGQNSL